MRRLIPHLALAALAAAFIPATSRAAACAADNGGITLPKDVCATVFADHVAHARHLTVDQDGTVYVNTWNPQGGGKSGRMIVALRDANGDGKADKTHRFGAGGDAVGGTGIAIHRGFLYAEAGDRIVRFRLGEGDAPPGDAQAVVDGLPIKTGHTMHPIAFGPDGGLYVNSGSPSNSCQEKDRTLHSPGKDPCEELKTRAGLWKFEADRAGQHFGPAERYATGLRNTVAFTFAPDGTLYAVPHGRDQLHENWPELFDARAGSELPAEMLVRVHQGDDFGWPYCYYDQLQHKYVLEPEYGGDGKKTDRCGDLPAPIAAYPGHWAPDGLLFYTGKALPERYRGGLFIAFHGSWNREKQQGYFVVFQPMGGDGKPAGKYEVFANGFAGSNKTPHGAAHRPTGLAQGPDGALYVSDDKGGRIWRITAR